MISVLALVKFCLFEKLVYSLFHSKTTFKHIHELYTPSVNNLFQRFFCFLVFLLFFFNVYFQYFFIS